MRFIPARPAHRRQDRRPRRHPRRLRDRPRHLPDARHRPGRDGHAAARASSSPSCPTASAPRRSSSGSRRWSRARSSRASPTSRTSPTASKGLRLVIEVKNGFVPEALLEQLYKLTPMEDSFGINNVALVDGQPRTLGLKELLEVFLEHRFDVVRRRSAFRRGKAADRLHLVDGLLVAILDIDEVIQLIRSSDNAAAAKERLMRGLRPHRDPGRLHPRHAAAPADEVLPDRAGEGEGRAASGPIEELDAILGDDKLLRKVVSDELAEVAKTYGTPAPHRPARVGRHHRRPRPRCRSRWPTTRASSTSPPAGCWPGPAAPSRPAPAAAGPTTT